MVCRADGTVKLVNLGVAVTLQEMAEYHKVRRVMPNWQTPEIIEGSPYTKEVDVWSLGCFAYELATGKQPFKMANWTKLLDHILNREAPPIPSRWSAGLQDFIDKCLEKNPEERYTVDQLLNEHELFENYDAEECKQAWVSDFKTHGQGR